MRRKSLASLQKAIVWNPLTPEAERIGVLKKMKDPSRRFLQRLLASDAPVGLQRVASRLLVKALTRRTEQVSSCALKAEAVSADTLPEAPQTPITRQIEVIPGEIWDLVGCTSDTPYVVKGPY